jgi:hypothetical protein
VKSARNKTVVALPEKVALQEAKIVHEETEVATAQVNAIERELGLPESTPVELLGEMQPAPVNKQPEPIEADSELVPGSPVKKLNDKEKEEMKKRFKQERAAMNATADAAEIAKRREALKARRQEIVTSKRIECQQQIEESNAKLSEKPKVVLSATEKKDPMDALKCALAGRVRAILEQVA